MEHNFYEQLLQPQHQGSIAILFGALVGGIRKVMAQGWKNWGWFLSSLIVNVFFGVLAYLVALEYGLGGLKPVILALVFGSLGEKSGDLVMSWALDYVKVKINTLK